MITAFDQLRKQLRSHNPVSLRHLMTIFDSSEGYGVMRNLISEYIPDDEQEILSAADPVHRFVEIWSEKCFGLFEPMCDVSQYEMFECFIPVELLGFSYEEYHEVPSWKDEYIVVLSLYESPFDDNARITLLEAAIEIAGKKLISRIPEKGYSVTDLRRWLDKTDYEPVALVGEYLWAGTGNFFWDFSPWNDDGMVYEGYWNDPDEVRNLIADWGPAMEIRDRMNNFMDWVKQDIPSRMKSILTAIEQAKEKDAGQLSLLADMLKDEDDPGQELIQV